MNIGKTEKIMKKVITFITFVALVLAFVGVTLCPVSADDTVYGDHIFGAERIMYFDEGTRFENGIVNGGIINPGTGAYSTYTGVKFDKTTYLGEEAVKVELLNGQTTGFFDFNYHQYNAEAEKPCLDASSYPYLKIRYAYVGAEDIYYMKFWAANKKELGNSGTNFDVLIASPRSAGEWQEAILYLEGMEFGDGTTWEENAVRQFRIHMF